MKIFSSLFGTKKTDEPGADTRQDVDEKVEAKGDVLRIARTLSPLIDELAGALVKKYQDILVAEPITFIVPSVWGASEGGPLTETQEEMHAMIAPVVQQAVAAFGFQGMTPEQEFALGFLIRGLIVSKIAHMVEILKTGVQNLERDLLSQIEPIGMA